MAELRDPETGQFLPGNRTSIKGGKAKVKQAETNRKYMAALVEALPPEGFAGEILELLAVAKEKNHTRVVLDILRFVAEYQLGKPKQRVDIKQETTTLEQWRMLIEGDNQDRMLVVKGNGNRPTLDENTEYEVIERDDEDEQDW